MLWPPLLLLLCAGSLAQDLEFQLVAPKSVTVEEGLCVHVPCSVSYPSIRLTSGSITGSWLRKGDSLHEDSPVATNDPRQLVQKATQGRFQLLGDPQKHDCSLLIRDAQKNDTGMYFFRVVREPFVRYSYKKSQLSLNVTSLSRTPDIIIPGTLEAGYPSNLTCSVPWACEQGTPPIFSWMSTALTSLSSRTTNSSVLILTPQPQDHGTKLTCLVTFSGAGVTVEKTIQLNVTWKSGQMREVVLAAVGEATVKLLILGLCLTFLIRKTTKLSVHTDCENPIKAHQQDSKVHSNPENPRPLQKDLPYEQNSIHTEISLDFMGGKPQEYSEI
ncbi:myeloid cell surface antigen CD33 isoform X2 [Mus pahari]|uniref:myeloid cell surface antigen CD33 isoform X2 n=1 Tax=Mus pahari TaxID=10093 RepID=UPI0011149DA6|nr:myeloid cell surface antigen CD33 isoform X2 [Mus pahari]